MWPRSLSKGVDLKQPVYHAPLSNTYLPPCPSLECGLDDPVRWETDFRSIYKTDKVPAIKDLKWYNVIGNHDLVADGEAGSEGSHSAATGQSLRRVCACGALHLCLSAFPFRLPYLND